MFERGVLTMKFRFLITTLLAVLGFSTGVFAHTVINIPLDSRPVSYEYFDNLSRIGGDNCITVSKDNLDYFSNDTTKNHLGNSLAVRDEVYNLVLNNNNKDTTVIINTSSYVTNGLVGSRCGVNYPQKIFNIAPYKYIVFGKNLRKFEFSSFDIAAFPLEAIKFLSDTIDIIPGFPYNKTRLKYILHAGDTLKLTKLLGYRFRNGVCQDLSDIQIEGGEIGEYLWGCENQTRGKVDLSKMKVSSDNRWSHCFYGAGQMVEEVIMPQEPFTGTYVRNCFYNCISLRKLVLPKSMPNVEDALGFLQNCKQLYDFELPSDFGSKGNGLILTMQYVPKTMRLDLKNTKIRCLVWSSEREHSSIGLIGLTFSSESPFDYQISNAHLYFQFAPLSYDAIIEIFNQLPNFKGESVRVININGCAGTSELTEEDIKIATDKNWQVIGV